MGQYGRPPIETAGLLVNFDVRAIWLSGLNIRIMLAAGYV